MADMKAFADWLHEQMIAAGYDLSSQRSGGKSKLANDAGVALSQVQRALGGTTRPDIVTLRAIAHALDIPMKVMLVRSGTVDAGDLDEQVLPASDLDVRTLGLQRGVPADKLDHWVAIVDAVTGTFAAERQHHGSATP
ncbi:helix-turn-helix domain-containing protein [Kitasatospora kifunensis]|uniref:DNA-binding phage protein n=1 Tax=Kitasatospora kifunensis TaxID=58351 RepID=A0A7W7QYT3_KITKI|nr:hypothetical protein [Kitasatospora kifunensis]MBB4922224.1 DNA-binding phage protein [Kitasatospora kifunensis]